MLTEFEQRMADAVGELKPGQVVSFGDIAAAAGKPNAARAAGRMLSRSADSLPWWRVVYGNGHLPPCNPSLQAERLADEGVRLVGFRVVASPSGRFQPDST